MKHIKYLAVLPLLGLALSACAEEKPAGVKPDSEQMSSILFGDEEETSNEEETPSEDVLVEEPEEVVVEEPEVEEPEQPEIATLGDTMILGDWEVKVTEVAKNANEVIARANMFNSRPKGQYVLVTYEATYIGSERTADVEMDLTWTLTTSDQRIHDEAWEVTPADNQEWPTTARRGGTVKTQVVFDVPPNLIDGGILSVETYDDNFDTVYADFGL